MLGALLLLGLSRAASGDIEVVPLGAADAATVIPVIEPLLAEGESVSGFGTQVIIQASPARIAEITELIEQLDVPPIPLTITVRQGTGDLGRSDARSGAGRIRIDDDGDTRVGAGVTVRSTRQTRDRRQLGTVQTVAGQPAYIDVGTAFPVIRQQLFPGAFGPIVQESTGYEYAGSGFYVTPRLSGSGVTLRIEPFLEDPPAGPYAGVAQRRLATTVQGRLGEWILLGGSLDEAERDQRRIVARTRKQSATDYGVWVKVERVTR